jgi:hypothetical protein
LAKGVGGLINFKMIFLRYILLANCRSAFIEIDSPLAHGLGEKGAGGLKNTRP